MRLAKNITAGFDKALQFAVWGAIGGAIASIIIFCLYKLFVVKIFQGSPIEINDGLLGVTVLGLCFGLFGVSITVSLLIASSQYLKRGLQIGQALKYGTLFGSAVGVIASAGAVALLALLLKLQVTSVAIVGIPTYIIHCGVSGGLIGLCLSFCIPNLGRLPAMAGGFVAGSLAGSLFVLLIVNFGFNVLFVQYAFVYPTVFGFCIGLAIAIIEVGFRQAWLEIRYNSRDIKTVSLGKVPIMIGSNVKACTVYVRNALPIALRYQFTQGQILCEDILSDTTHKLQREDEQTIGNITIVVKIAE
jgi:hypothetical protein